MVGPIHKADLMTEAQRPIAKGIRDVRFERHRSITDAFPAYIAAKGCIDAKSVVTICQLCAIHHSIVLATIIGLPAEETRRDCHTKLASASLVDCKAATYRNVKEISRSIVATTFGKAIG